MHALHAFVAVKSGAATSPKLLGFVSLRAAITFANISSDPARAAPQLVVPGR